MLNGNAWLFSKTTEKLMFELENLPFFKQQSSKCQCIPFIMRYELFSKVLKSVYIISFIK